MKKSFLMFGVAAMALASCTQNEVVEYAENRAIQFDTFVNNNTRAVTPVVSLTNFYVFGEFGDAEDTYGSQVYANELNTTTHYWVASKYYSFGAYANGEAGKIENATFDANAKKLTFPGYTPNDAQDLVVATNALQANSNVAANTPVSLNFKHMLSQVKFTFKTTDADAYTLKISNLQINNAVTKATGTYTDGVIDWSTEPETGNYAYTEIADVAIEENNYTASEVKLVIPQENTNSLKVTFKATISGSGLAERSSTFTADLAYAVGTVSGTEANTWTPGFVYNYVATINADQIDPILVNQKIEFTPTVTPWKPAADTDNGELVKD